MSIVSIGHVGSTCIPLLKAKPVLDIDIIIGISSLEATRIALVNAGHAYCGEMNVPGRFAFRQPEHGKFSAAHDPEKNGGVRYNTCLMVGG